MYSNSGKITVLLLLATLLLSCLLIGSADAAALKHKRGDVTKRKMFWSDMSHHGKQVQRPVLKKVQDDNQVLSEYNAYCDWMCVTKACYEQCVKNSIFFFSDESSFFQKLKQLQEKQQLEREATSTKPRTRDYCVDSCDGDMQCSRRCMNRFK